MGYPLALLGRVATCAIYAPACNGHALSRLGHLCEPQRLCRVRPVNSHLVRSGVAGLPKKKAYPPLMLKGLYRLAIGRLRAPCGERAAVLLANLMLKKKCVTKKTFRHRRSIRPVAVWERLMAAKAAFWPLIAKV